MTRPPHAPPESEQETVIGRAPHWRPVAAPSDPNAVPTGFEETVIAASRGPGPAPLPVPTGAAAPAHSQRDDHRLQADGSLVGIVLADRYELVRLIGEGGMGLVYEARHVAIDRRVAVKVLASEFCGDRTQVERFMREAKTTAKIEHENIVEISDVGAAPNGSVFFVMEFLQGEDLGAMIDRERAQTWARTRHLMLQVCAAISAAHAHGIVHRDLKPQNCFRTTRHGDSDFVKVLDFGIAKLLGEEHQAGRKLTRSGQIFGTPEYMSPEQVRGMPADPRMDVYAAGVILFELLTGRTPFEGDAPLEVLAKHLREPIPDASAMRTGTPLPVQVDGIIRRALAKHVDERFQSAEELATAIRGVDPTKTVPVGGGVAQSTDAAARRMPLANRIAVVAGSLMLAAAAVIGVAKLTNVFGERGVDAVAGVAVQPGAPEEPRSLPATENDALVAPDARPSSDDAREHVAPETPAPTVLDPARPESESDARPATADEPSIIAQVDPADDAEGSPSTDTGSPTRGSSEDLPSLSDKKIRRALDRLALDGCYFRGGGWKAQETVSISGSAAAKTGKLKVVSATHSTGKTAVAECVAAIVTKSGKLGLEGHAPRKFKHEFKKS